jgi:hypothetical protein
MSRIKKQILNKLKEYANKMGRDHLGGDDYTSKKKGGLRDFDGYDNVDYNKDMPMDEDSPESAHPQGSKKLTNRTTVIDMLDVISHKEFGPDYHKLSTKQKKEVHKLAIKGKLIKQSPFKESVNERADYKYLTQVILDAKPKYDVYYNSSHNVVNIGGVGYGGGDLVKNFNQKPGSSSKIKNNFYHANQDPQKTKREVEKLSKGKIKVKIGKGGFLSYSLKESVNEGMFSMIDQIRQDSKDVRDFVKNVFKDKEFRKMKDDKEFIKYLKSIYEGINEAIPQNFHQGRTSDYHTALRGKNRDYSGGTNFKKKNHGQPDVEEDDEDQETNHLSNKQTHIKSDKLKVSEEMGNLSSSERIELYKLYSKAMKAMPGSPNQKKLKVLINKLRKKANLTPLPEYGQRLDLSFIEDDEARLDGTPKPKDAIDTDIDETAKRDYKDEYKKFQSSKKSKKYRAELNKYNRQKGTYGNGDGKDASHKGGKIVGFESASKNRGRKEKSRLKKK